MITINEAKPRQAISLTEKAVAAVKRLSDAEGIGHYTIRVKVSGGGCGGLKNDIHFEDMVEEIDEILEQDGIKVVVDPMSMQYLDGTEIDFVDDPFGSGFRFSNPNSSGSCGCGSSYSV